MKKFNLVFLSIIVLIASCVNRETENRNNLTQNEINQDAFPLPRKVVLANLPDSLQPKILLQKDIKTVTAVIPKKGKAPFVFSDPDGKEHRETLEQPVAKLLPVLRDENGELILDKNGEPIVMGEGGTSQFTNYTTDDGLSIDIITCSTTDSRGNLWFGTNGGGASCYDGTSFTTYKTEQGLANNSVRGIAADRSGNIWVGTDGGGLSRFDGKKFTTYTTEQGLPENDIVAIDVEKTGNILISTFTGKISRFNGGNIYAFPHDFEDLGYLVTIFNDNDENVRYLFSKGIASFDGNSFTKITDVKGLPNWRLRSFLKDQYGNYWFTNSNGIYRYNSMKDLINGKYIHFTTEHGLPDNLVKCSIEDNMGNLWFGTGKGLSKYEYATDSTDERFTTFTTLQGLADNSVTTITKDKAGSLWFGTDGGGVSRYDGQSITNFSTTQGLVNNNVRTIAEDKKGNLWFGSFGASRYDGKSFINYSNMQGLQTNLIKCSFKDKTGNLWFGGQFGLCRYESSADNQTEKIVTYIDPVFNGGAFWSILQDKQGSIWFATQINGIIRLDDKGFTFFSTNQGLASNDVRSIAEDNRGNLWFGTYGSGLSCFDGKRFMSITTEQGLSQDFVMCITTDKSGNLWIGTQDGLNFLSAGKIKRLLESATISESHQMKITKDVFKKFTVLDGLPNNYIIQVVELPNGKMAVGTNRGIVFFDKPSEKTEEFNKLTGLEIFNSSTGYPVKNVSVGQNAMYLDSKGILWAGTRSNQSALVRFDFKTIRKKVVPLKVSLKRISINENDISWYDLAPEFSALQKGDSLSFPPNITEEVTIFGRPLKEDERHEMKKKYAGIRFDDITPFYPVPINLVLPYKHNNITIHYATNELAKPGLVQYQYILEGFDREWSPVLKNTYAPFGNMKEGKYTFKVKARYTGLAENGADNWTEPVNYTFRVLPPWYRSWLAYIIYSLFFALAVWQIHLFQKARTLRVEREKSQKRELEHAKEIEKAYQNLGVAHENLKSTQSQLIQSEKMASLGELTAGIAHEIQNPLNFVNNFSEVSNELIVEVEEERAKNPESRDEDLVTGILSDIKQNLEKINHHGKRADAIVKGMLQHSRTSTGQKELTDINALADEYLRLAYHGMRAKDKTFNADFKLEADENLPKINVIPQDIGRVLLNLINNAFYVVNEKSKQNIEGYKPEVVVSTSSSPFEKGGIKGGLNGEVTITVSDNGPGIPAANIDKIFQPFFTTKPTGSGTGLGLSLSYDIVKAHGGELMVETIEGEGTEFIIQIPIKSN